MRSLSATSTFRCGLLLLLSLEANAAEIVGRVRDVDTGEELASAVVRAIPIARNQREVQVSAKSDGSYQLDLVRGKYRLFVSLPDSDYLPQFYSAAGHLQGDVIDVAAFESFRIINLSLRSGGSISGTVLRAADSTTLPNIRIQAIARDFRTSTQSHSDGTYRFRALPPGNYKILAQPLDENFIPVYYGNVRDGERALTVALNRSQAVTGIDFRLRYGGIISGRVYANKNREPVSGIRVIAESQSRQEPPFFTTTDLQGFYTLSGLTEGSYTVEAVPGRDNGSNRLRKAYLVQFHGGRFDRALADRLEIEAGTAFTGIDFSMVESGSISGTVRSRYHNKPLSDVTLVTQDDERSVLNPFQSTTDAEGRFLVSDLPPGDYWVETSLPPQVRRLVNFFYRDKLSVEKADRIRLEEGEKMRQVDFSLPLGGTIRGEFRVEDPEYALKPAGKSVSMRRQGVDLEGFGKRDFKLKADGSFLIERTPPGRYALSPILDDPNLLPLVNLREKTVEVTEGDLIEGVEFPLRVVGSISGRISLQNRTLSLEKLVLLLISLKDNNKSYFDLPSESYTISGVEPGKYFMVLLTKPDPSPSPFGLPSGQVFDTRVVEVERGRTTPAANFQVRFEPDSKPRMFQ